METNDLLTLEAEKPKLPSGLNVLTILTFIGCALGAIMSLVMGPLYKWLLGFMDKAANSGQELSQKDLDNMQKGKAALELVLNNLVPIIALTLIGVVLCFLGALWMRKLKKDGYWIYVAGQIVPIVGSFVIMGTSQFTGVSSYLFGLGIPLLFIILYTLQRKHLKY